MNGVTEKECISFLVNKVRQLREMHLKGRTYCDATEMWKQRDYGWQNPYFPPEYRKCCLKGTAFTAEPSCDLYFLMIEFFEMVTGQEPPVNFQLSSVWKRMIMENTKDWRMITQTAVISFIEMCTKLRRENRIQSAEELAGTEMFKQLLKE